MTKSELFDHLRGVSESAELFCLDENAKMRPVKCIILMSPLRVELMPSDDDDDM